MLWAFLGYKDDTVHLNYMYKEPVLEFENTTTGVNHENLAFRTTIDIMANVT